MRQEKEEEKDAYFMDARRRRSVGWPSFSAEGKSREKGGEGFSPFLFWKKREGGVRERKNGKEEKNIILPSARIKLA